MMDDDPRPTETKEQFLAHYPSPGRNRILVECRCPDGAPDGGYNGCTGWAWVNPDLLERWETPAE